MQGDLVHRPISSGSEGAGIAVFGRNLFVSTYHGIELFEDQKPATPYAGSATLSGHNDGARHTSLFSDPAGLCIPRKELDAAENALKSNPSALQVIEPKAQPKTGLQKSSSANTLSSTPQPFTFPALYVADQGNNCVRLVDKNLVVTYAGQPKKKGFKDGAGKDALFDGPTQIAELNGTLYVTDMYNHRIRVISTDGMVTSIGIGVNKTMMKDGPITDCSFVSPCGICVGPDSTLLVTDVDAHLIRAISLRHNTVWTLAGSTKGYLDSTPFAAKFCSPTGIACTEDGVIFVTDNGNDVVRVIGVLGTVSTLKSRNNAVSSSTAIWSRDPNAICLSSCEHLYWVESEGDLCVMTGITASTVNAATSSKFEASLSAPSASRPTSTKLTAASLKFLPIHPAPTPPSQRPTSPAAAPLPALPVVEAEDSLNSSGSEKVALASSTTIKSPTTRASESKLLEDAPFTALLQGDGLRLADVSATHVASNTIIHLHSGVLALQKLDANAVAQALGAAKFSRAKIDVFVALLYGDYSVAVALSSDATSNHAMMILELFHLSCVTSATRLKSWLAAIFSTLLVTLKPAQWTELLLYNIHNCDRNKFALDMLCLEMRRSPPTFHESIMPLLKATLNSAVDGKIIQDIANKVDDETTDLYAPPTSFSDEAPKSPSGPDPLLDGIYKLSKFIKARSRSTSEGTDAPSSSTAPTMKPDVEIRVAGSDQVIDAHLWVLYCRWPYIHPIVASSPASDGLPKHTEISFETTPGALVAFFQFLYSGSLDQSLLSPLDCLFFARKALSLRLVNVDDPTKPLPFFEPLLNHCNSIVQPRLTVHNCIAQLRLYIEWKWPEAVEDALKFVSKRIRRLPATPETRAVLAQLPPEITRKILELQLKA